MSPSFPFYFFNDDAQDMFLFLRIFGQENESCTIFTFFRYRDALQQDEFVWNLYHDTCTVARLVVGAFSSAVFHVFQHPQGRIHQFVRLASVQVHNHSHAAGIVLVRGVIESFLSPVRFVANLA